MLVRIQYQEKSDIKDLGVILLEIIVGRNISTQNEVEIVMDQVRASHFNLKPDSIYILILNVINYFRTLSYYPVTTTESCIQVKLATS